MRIPKIKKGQKYSLFGVELAKNDPDGVAKYLHMVDPSTDRTYYIPVHPKMEKAKDALLWYLNLENEPDYIFEEET